MNNIETAKLREKVLSMIDHQYSLPEIEKALDDYAGSILKNMDEYAEQEAKAYASWLSHTVIRGRTASKLWNDYKSEIQ